jgi:hypothetical protein
MRRQQIFQVTTSAPLSLHIATPPTHSNLKITAFWFKKM